MFKPRLNRHHALRRGYGMKTQAEAATELDNAVVHENGRDRSLLAPSYCMQCRGARWEGTHTVVAMSLVVRPRVEYKQSIAFLAAHALFHIEQAFYARSSYAKSPPCPLPAPSPPLPLHRTHTFLFEVNISQLFPRRLVCDTRSMFRTHRKHELVH